VLTELTGDGLPVEFAEDDVLVELIVFENPGLLELGETELNIVAESEALIGLEIDEAEAEADFVLEDILVESVLSKEEVELAVEETEIVV
jgi:hypothetical protein